MRNPRRLIATLFLVFSACFAARAQSGGTGASVQFADLGDFKLHSGGVIRDLRIGYRTLGNLDASRTNAILWPTWLGGRTENLLPLVGPGNVADTGKYYVILIESIGNGISSSPSNSKLQPLAKFPEFSIRDMVESEYQLSTAVLHLSRLHAVMGISMGGMQTFAWAAVHPDFMDVAIPMAGSPQSSSYDKLLWTAEIDAIELDPAWNHGNPTRPLSRGPALSAEIDSMNVTTPAYRVTQTSPKDITSFVGDLKKRVRGDAGAAWDQIRQRQAIISFDLPGELGFSLDQIAKQVRTKMLVIVSPEDHMVNPGPALQFASALGAPVVELDSPCGHLSFTCISVGPVVAQFLADPSSVHSQTLHEAAGR
jgi:homoserine O-acetyltransferase/O-succinyltransferase